MMCERRFKESARLVFLFLSPLVLPAPCPGAEGGTPPVVVNEIMFNPDGDENAREFVELLNLSDEAVSLEGFRITDGTGSDPVVPARGGGWLIPPGGYAVVFDPDYFDAGEPYADVPEDAVLFTVTDRAIGSRGLSNSRAETVSLVSDTGDTLSSVTYSLECPPGHSWERVVPSGGDGAGNFAPSVIAGGSPGRPNTVTPPSENPVLHEGAVRFVPPAPAAGDDVTIYVSYRNGGLSPLSGVAVDVILAPDAVVGSAVFLDEVVPGEVSEWRTVPFDDVPGGCLALTGYVRTAGGRVSDSLTVALDVRMPPGTLILSEVMASPGGGPEWVEIENTGADAVDLYGFVLRDGAGNAAAVWEHVFLRGGGFAVFSSGFLDCAPPDGGVLVVMDDFPRLNDDGDSVVLLDWSGAVLDSMSYEDAPRGRSLERISRESGADRRGWDASTDDSGSTPWRENSISFVFVPDGGPGSPVLTVHPNPFEDTVTISYSLPFPLARVNLYVYDRRGRLVAKLRDAEESGSSWSCVWDGRRNGGRLPAGPYILDLEAFDKRTGRVVRKRTTVVAAARL